MCPNGMMSERYVPFTTGGYQEPAYIVDVPLPFCGCVVQPVVTTEESEELPVAPDSPGDDADDGAVLADMDRVEHPPHVAADQDADQNNLDGCVLHPVP